MFEYEDHKAALNAQTAIRNNLKSTGKPMKVMVVDNNKVLVVVL